MGEVRLTNAGLSYAEGLTAEGRPYEIVVDAYGGTSTPSSSRRRISATWPTTSRRTGGRRRRLRAALNAKYEFASRSTLKRALSHIQWTEVPTVAGAYARNAVFYGKRPSTVRPAALAPPGARMAQRFCLRAKGQPEGRRRVRA